MEREDFEKLIEAVKVMPLLPTDRVVLRLKETLSDEAREQVKVLCETIFPGHGIVVLDGGADISVIREEQAPGLLGGRMRDLGDDIVSFDGIKMSVALLTSLTRPTPPGRWLRVIDAEGGVATVEMRDDLKVP